ncbi:MAG: glutamate synthase large subunit [Cytophagales bacterium]|nr:glutamate synthase large subunit [Bernardetiaceae bacterium]MDW8210770.1 glutamate synthase large subunit [Cytophagales bacterium]
MVKIQLSVGFVEHFRAFDFFFELKELFCNYFTNLAVTLKNIQLMGQFFQENEKSACGVGFVASRKGVYDHRILQQALHALKCEEHRGACAADRITGDGAGIMTDIPFDLLGYKKGEVAVASLFLPTDAEKQRIALKTFEESFALMGLEVIQYRDVPINLSVLGQQARESMPDMRHAIIARPKHCRTDYSFDKLLYQAKQFNRIRQRDAQDMPEFFFTSLSANTIIYKGLLRAEDLDKFYLDLQNPAFKTRFAIFHRRFSTNTISTWDKAQPFRFISHNGEINTIQGNRSWAFSREKALGLKKNELLNHYRMSDSGSLNEMVEALAFRSSIRYIEDILAIMIPPAQNDKDFYRFWSRAMEPWDGPALVIFGTGTKVGARLDRNGFRPCRWAMTEDYFYLSSEAGSFNIEESEILRKGTLNAGTGVTMNLLTGHISFTDPADARENIGAHFDARLLPMQSLRLDNEELLLNKKYLFTYTEEDISRILIPMMSTGKEPIGSMGDTARLAIFSEEPRSFFDYFYQAFAQVTNPPLDYLREKNVTDIVNYLGKKPNIFAQKELIPPPPAYELKSPVLSLGEMAFIRELKKPSDKIYRPLAAEFDITFPRKHGAIGLQRRLDELGKAVVETVNSSEVSVIILSDRKASYEQAPIPSLLALRAVIVALTDAGLRLEASIVVDSGEVRTTHHVACLIGFGATAVCPYLALQLARYETAHKMSKVELSPDEKERNVIKALNEGLLKVMSKMGISVLRSYQSSKLFSIVGLHKEVVQRYFPRVHNVLGGLTISNIADEIIRKLDIARKCEEKQELVNNYLFREDTIGNQGEKHYMTFARSKIIHQLVRSTGKGLDNMELYDEYLRLGVQSAPVSVRHLFTLKKSPTPTPMEQVEARSAIMRRFGSGAMSFGAISAEAQRDIILAMREIGGRSNSGEGGENPYYFTEGITASTKQVASARFGVTALYLVSGNELQIKIAQGAKPGEGGQLMSVKVNADIARARFSNPHVDLISPPPLHDIYSIEDLKQLIYELKQICPEAKVNVKLVAGANIGTIAVGVAKAGADIIDVVGGDGGTGAASLSSMKHAGLPWEFGLVEVHQALLQNNLRKYVKLRTDGGLSTGEDIVMAAIMGAEEFNFGKLLLVAEGCVMARICEKNTCPAGITTHDPVYKAKYKGHKDHIVKLMEYLAEDVRRKLSHLGVRSIDEIIGRTDLLEINPLAKDLINRRNLDLSFVLGRPMPGRQTEPNPFFEGVSPLNARIVEDTRVAIAENKSAEFSYTIRATDRAVLATVAGEIARKENRYRQMFYKDKSLYPYTKTLKFTFTGSAGQGFAVFMTDGMEVKLYGEANDSVAKSMSGGKLVITPQKNVRFQPEENVIIGNCALYGATGGVLYVHGIAGDRFAVRNSGAYAVVEGVGLHACEYMTRGKVVILGEFDQNLGSGMTGGEVYLYKPQRLDYINREYLTEVAPQAEDWEELFNLLQDYLIDTGSKTVAYIIQNWEVARYDFVRLVPVNTIKKKKPVMVSANSVKV